MTARRFAALALALALGAGTARAQTVRPVLGDSLRVKVAAGEKIRVPLSIDMTSAGVVTLAHLITGVTWGVNRLTFDSLRVVAASGLSVTPDLTNAGTGSLSVDATWSTPLSSTATLLTLYFTAGPSAGGARIAMNPTLATSGAGGDLLGSLRPEAHEVCAALGAKWGDVNNNGSVTIADAQQIARYSVGLSVANPGALERRGDVTANGTITTADAQQIARWVVGLSAAARINTTLLEYPTANNIVVSPTSAGITEGAATAVVATVRDSVNNSLAGCYPVTWSTSNAAVATVSSAGNVTAVAPGSATITATSGSLSAAATITVGQRATTLTAQSAVAQDGTAGAAVPARPSVKVTDVRGDPVAGVTVTFAVATGGGSVGTATATSDADGIATLDSWTLGTSAGSNTLTATAEGLTGSPITFTATALAGAASQLVLTTQPSGAVSGVALTAQPVVEVRDQYGNLVTTSSATITVTKATGSGALSGTATVNAVNGVATFTGLTISGLGSHTLAFGTGSLEVTSSAFTVSQVAASLVLTTQPAGAVSGAAFTTQPVVEIRDNANLPVTTGSGATLVVSAAIASGTGTLGGTASATATSGVATFTNLAIPEAGTYTLEFTTASPALAVTSGTLTVTAGAAAAIAANSTTSQSATVGTAVTTPPSVVLTDASGNPVAGVSVTFAVASGGGSVTGGSATTDVDGIATVGSWTLGTTAGPNTLTATSGTLSGSPVTFGATGTQTTLTVGGSVTANDKVYDGTTAATGTTTGLTLVGVASGDAVTIGSVTLAFATAGVGTGKPVSITGVTLGGAEAYRYVVSLAGAPTASASITPAASSVTVTGGTSFTYTGTSQGPATASVTGSTGAITYSYEGTGTTTYGPSVTAPTNAGTYAVTAAVAADANYASASSAASGFTIAQVALTVTAGDQTVAYGTPVATVTGAGTYSLSGFVAGETAAVVSGTVTYTTSYTATTDAGTAAVTITPVVTGLAATNYSFTPVAGVVTITQASQTISFGDAPTVVVGGTGTVSATATSGLVVSFTSTTTGVCTVDGTTVTGVTAGTCTIQGTQAGSGNYAAAPAVTQSFPVGQAAQVALVPRTANGGNRCSTTNCSPASSTRVARTR